MSNNSEASNHAALLGAGNLDGLRVTVVGLGRFGGGLGVTRWLHSQGAIVTVSDQASEESLADSVRELKGLDVALHLGSHDEDDFLQADLLVVNPAMPKNHPLLQAAAEAGVPRTSEINLFLQRCPAPVVGITGSVGKSTTTILAGAVLSRKYTTHVGGNIGRSLLEKLPEIKSDHIVVLELSSFQLEDTPIVGISPSVALVTNVFENHLDRYAGSLAHYADAKKNIFRFQSPDDVLILNRKCGKTAGWANDAAARVDWFDEEEEPFELVLPGRHNQANAQAAWAIGRQFDVDREQAAAALGQCIGLPHRLQFVTEFDGVRYYNDSKCTTPTGAIVALNSFEPGRCVILLGGYDKDVSFDSLAIATGHAKAVVTFGQTRKAISAAVKHHRQGNTPSLLEVETLPEALQAARGCVEAGDVILFSPACASYDQFDNYEKRGETFLKLVMELQR